MSAIALGIAGAGLAYNVVNGIVQNNKANAIKPKDPVYNIPSEFYANREIARQMAQIGMPQQQQNNAENDINQTQAAALVAAQNSNNPGAAITSIARQGNKANATLNAEDAQARQTNQRYFINENNQLGQQELTKQQNDVYDKFTRDFNQMQAYKGAANQNFNNAISGAQQLGQTALANQTPTSDSTDTSDFITGASNANLANNTIPKYQLNPNQANMPMPGVVPTYSPQYQLNQ